MAVQKKQIKDMFFLVLKVLIFLYIIASPFINPKNLSLLNTIPVKVIILILVVVSAFYDFQLAILLTIAFFVLLINFNRQQFSSLFPGSQAPVPVALAPAPVPTPIASSPVTDLSQVSPETIPRKILPEITENPTPTDNLLVARTPLAIQMQDNINATIAPYSGETAYDFPNEKCNTKPFEDTGINNHLINYYIDPKVKPYEVYIRMMTSSENLQSAQTNSVQNKKFETLFKNM